MFYGAISWSRSTPDSGGFLSQFFFFFQFSSIILLKIYFKVIVLWKVTNPAISWSRSTPDSNGFPSHFFQFSAIFIFYKKSFQSNCFLESNQSSDILIQEHSRFKWISVSLADNFQSPWLLDSPGPSRLARQKLNTENLKS